MFAREIGDAALHYILHGASIYEIGCIILSPRLFDLLLYGFNEVEISFDEIIVKFFLLQYPFTKDLSQVLLIFLGNRLGNFIRA